MLKTIKFIYRLGVKNERQRIAAFLQTAQNRRYDHVRELERSLGMKYREGDEAGTMAEVEERRAKEQIAVDNAVIDIISQLFSSEERIERGGSVMFPEEKK
jgi:hypothetical protein